MAIGIQDVARAAGVHISTVSRTFSAPHLVRAETRRRVIAVAEELGYRPNRAARSLATGRTQNVGLVVADIGNPYFPPLIKAAQAQAAARDYHVFVADTDEDPLVEEELVYALTKQVDGVLLGSPRMSNRRVRELAENVPLVVVNRRVKGVPAVLMDLRAGSRTAVEHLAALGHTRLALLVGPTGSWLSSEMRRGANAAARARDVTITVFGPSSPTEAGGASAAGEILRTGATGVLAYNDLMAIGLVEDLDRLGARVPDDVSVVGVDDIGASRLTRPKLTTVAMPTAAAGRTAIDILLQRAADTGPGTATVATLETRFVVRESSAAVRRSGV
ncbi:MAG: LacI family DNA-binding transcriptional regulator [Streptosporangiaceae bacterium]